MFKYSKTKVNKAGSVLKNKTQHQNLEVLESENVLTYWRTIHAPVINTFQATLRTKISKKYKKNGFVAQRLKRAPSIIAKLKREPHMKLSTMQDIAGVRAVLKNLKDVFSLSSELKNSTAKHKLISESDYIRNPKKSGYRSIHLIFEYANNKLPECDELKIEVQIRTQLQHIWATSVETMGTFLDTSLKSSEGPKPILDFFALTSSAFAILEKSTLIPGYEFYPTKTIFQMVIDQFIALEIRDKLTAYSVIVGHIDKHSKNSRYYLVILDLKNKNVRVQNYSKHQLEKANIDYTNTERAITAGAELQAVLVSLESISGLKKAYPNYFLDTNDFLSKIELIRNLIPKM